MVFALKIATGEEQMQPLGVLLLLAELAGKNM